MPAPNPDGAGPGRLYDVSRYIDLFTKLPIDGGLKTNPDDVLLFAVDAPDEPFQVILSNPGTSAGQPFVHCGLINETSNPPCVPVIQHSCMNAAQPEFFGDPAVRLNTVVRAVKRHAITSICDNDDSRALELAARRIAAPRLGCIQPALAMPPDCVVEDVTLDPFDGSAVRRPVPGCDTGSLPCWRVLRDAACDGWSADGVRLVVERGGAPAPAGSSLDARCTPAAP